jgi:hypothetical protein
MSARIPQPTTGHLTAHDQAAARPDGAPAARADLNALDRGVIEAGVTAAAAMARVSELEAAVAALTRRLAAAEALTRRLAAAPTGPPSVERVADLGRRLLGVVDELEAERAAAEEAERAAAEEAQMTGYDRAAAVQARRRQIQLVRPAGAQR